MNATRKALMLALAVGLLTAPPAAEAQQQVEKVWRIGILTILHPPEAEPPKALPKRLRELGYVEGQNLVIERRNAYPREDRLPSLAAELVRLKVDLIVADTSVAIQAAKQATSTIPIVMVLAADALGLGLISELGRPGGNVTGITTMLAELSGKRLQLFKEAVPRISRVGVLWTPSVAWHKAMLREVDAAAPSLRLQALAIPVRSRDDFGDAFSQITKDRVDALFVSQTMSSAARRQIVDFAAKTRLPTMFINRDYVAAGGLMSYAASYSEMFRQAAMYVDKVLKGAKPGDLPVEQPTQFELVINLKTAKALALTIPPSVLARADEVIQ